MEVNLNYCDLVKFVFVFVIFKGGGFVEDFGCVVMEIGEFDYGWNLQLVFDVIVKMVEGGKGMFVVGFGFLVECLMLN